MNKEFDKKKVFVLFKRTGVTPLQCIEAFKKNNPLYQKEILSYAGRLDPMAEGLLLVLVGNENKNRKQYEHLEKTYDFDILVGISTDSYDVMGTITHTAETSDLNIEKGLLESTILHLPHTLTLPYPPFSSKRIGGKPLFAHARDGTLPEKMPTQTIEIKSLVITGKKSMDSEGIQNSIVSRISQVKGEFRQEEILKGWDVYFREHTHHTFTILSCNAVVSSGSYIRGIVHHLSQIIQVPLLTYSIYRTSIGPYQKPEYD